MAFLLIIILSQGNFHSFLLSGLASTNRISNLGHLLLKLAYWASGSPSAVLLEPTFAQDCATVSLKRVTKTLFSWRDFRSLMWVLIRYVKRGWTEASDSKKVNSALDVPLSLKHFLLSEVFRPHCLPLVDLVLQLEVLCGDLRPVPVCLVLGFTGHHKSVEMMHTHSPPARIGNGEGRGFFFSSGCAQRADVFQPAFFGVAVSRERCEHQNPVQVHSLVLCGYCSPCSDFVQLHLTQVSNTEFHKVGKVDLTIRI